MITALEAEQFHQSFIFTLMLKVFVVYFFLDIVGQVVYHVVQFYFQSPYYRKSHINERIAGFSGME
jgi:hypothetical protein